MKSFATLALAAAFAGGITAAAQAVPYEAFEADVLEAGPGVSSVVGETPHHPCLGQASGTAHHSCGTATGGPSGGLF